MSERLTYIDLNPSPELVALNAKIMSTVENEERWLAISALMSVLVHTVAHGGSERQAAMNLVRLFEDIARNAR